MDFALHSPLTLSGQIPERQHGSPPESCTESSGLNGFKSCSRRALFSSFRHRTSSSSGGTDGNRRSRQLGGSTSPRRRGGRFRNPSEVPRTTSCQGTCSANSCSISSWKRPPASPAIGGKRACRRTGAVGGNAEAAGAQLTAHRSGKSAIYQWKLQNLSSWTTWSS